MATNPLRSRTPAGPGLHSNEWDFKDSKRLPNTQLPVCHLYEYAREQATRNVEIAGALQALRQLNNRPENQRLGSSALYQRIFRLYGPAAFDASFANPEFPNRPWLGLTETDKAKLQDSFSKEAAKLTADIRGSLRIDLDFDLGKSSTTNFLRFQDDMRTGKLLPPDYGSWRTKALQDGRSLFAFEGYSDSDVLRLRETGFILIDWSQPDAKLKGAFDQWLKDRRSLRPNQRKGVASERGKLKRRADLVALGADRLLRAGFTAGKAIAYTETESRLERPLYGNPKDWYQARNHIVPRVLRAMFPISTDSTK